MDGFAVKQKAALLAKGWTQEELKASGWQPALWNMHTLKQWHDDESTRNYLVCPSCNKIGTYKPRYNAAHEHPHYWVCKWCGYGRDYFGCWRYRPNLKTGCWGVVTPDSGKTPKELCGNLDPWLG